MASTPEGRRLTEEHRQAQQDVRDGFLAEFIALWALLDTANLDATGPGWVAATMRLVRAFRLRSAEVATGYYWDFRAAEAPDSIARPRTPDLVGPETPPPPAAPRTGRPPRRDRRASASPRSRTSRDRNARRELDRALEGSGIRWDFDESAFDRPERRATIEIPEIDWTERDRKAVISLNITGPIGQKSRIGKGESAGRARDASFVESSGVASRHVLTGGRRSLLTLLQVHRWARVTDGDPCAYCAMLAGRGPVYLTRQTASFSAHDHCACTAEPVYSSDAPWPGRAAEFREMWDQHIKGRYSGKEARRQWQRIYRQLQRESRQLEVG
jgi:hypothetical protein